MGQRPAGVAQGPHEHAGSIATAGPDAALERAGRRPARLLLAAYGATVLTLITLNFLLPRAMPGDPISALYTEGSPTYVQDATARERLRAYYGLDEPLGSQYADYLTGLAQADLGTSIRFQVPVADLVSERLPRSLLLMGTALVLGTGLGVLAGMAAGWRRGRRVDRGLLVAFIGLQNLPVFFVASIAVFVFGVKLGWFPLSGSSTPFAELGPLERAGDVAYHLALPATVLAAQFATGQFLLMRAGMVSELGSDYLLAGRAKGLSDRILRRRYAGRNALLPVASLMAIHLGAMVTLMILVETVFRYEGLGRLLFEAIRFRDYPVLQGCLLVLTLMVVTANFLADLAYRRLDPRVET